MDKYDLIDIVEQIEQADEIQLNQIINAVMCRYNTLHTDRILGFLSLSTDPQTRDQELKTIEHFIRVYSKQPDPQ